MDSSSDGSFAWTDASDDTSDNDTMAKTHTNTSQSGEESESGKTYKKKLQKRLFSGSTDDGTENSEVHSPRKRKMSQKYSDSDDHVANPKKSRIKMEPESDVDMGKVKKKYKSLEVRSQDLANGSYDETYLDLKVKNEQSFAVPSPVKLKKSKSESVPDVTDVTEINGDVTQSRKSPTSFEIKATHSSNSSIHFEDRSISLAENENKCEFDKIKKKKNKSKKKINDSEDEEIVKDSSFSDNFCTDDITVIEQSIGSNQNDDSPDELDSNTTSDVLNKVQTIKKKSKQEMEKITNGNISKSQISDHSILSENNTIHKSRISERITFEEEDDSNVQTIKTKIPNIKTRYKSKITNFLKSSVHLRPFSAKLSNNLVVTDEDDVWVIRCPKDINVGAFQDKKWTLDSKCKIKLEGQTYEGDVDDRQRNMTIVSAVNEQTVIKKLSINGCVRLHRRTPKDHIPEGNVIISNQNKFIPLPETKCRHPLFGYNYKKAIKIPASVAERLREPEMSASRDKRKKKDRRKSGCYVEVTSTTPRMEQAPTSPAELEHVTTSKRKRKHVKDEPEAQHRHKRIKHDPGSAAAWDCEKAIEENLFNF